MLSIGSTREDLRSFFTGVRRVGRSGDAELWPATGRTGPWVADLAADADAVVE